MGTKKPTAKVAQTFLSKVLSNINKSDDQIQQEVITDRIEDFKVDCKSQIALIETSTIPGLTNDLTRATRNLKKEKADLESTKLDVVNNKSFEQYVLALYNADMSVDNAASTVSSIKEAIANANAQCVKFKEILDTFNQ